MRRVHLARRRAPVRSCSVPASTAAGKQILTIEGLSPDGTHPIQIAWKALDAPQCGYCQSGMIMSAVALLRGASQPLGCRHRCRGHQRLPLQHLPPGPQGDPPGREPHEAGMTGDQPNEAGIDRREFLSLVAAAQGAFVLGFFVPSRAGAQTPATTPSGACGPGAADARDQRLDRRRPGRHRDDPHRADRTGPGRLDLQRHDGVRGTAVRLEQGPPAVRVGESDAREKAPTGR